MCVKTPLTLLQQQPELCPGNIVKFVHIVLCLIPGIPDPIDGIFSAVLVRKLYTVTDSVMLKMAYIRHIAAGKNVCVNPVFISTVKS